MKIEEYWSNEFGNILEFREIAKIENAQIQKVNTEFTSLVSDQFILSAKKSGIERREKMLGIKMVAETLEERRLNVFSRWNKKLPYTYNCLYNIIANSVGEQNFTMSLKAASYFLELIIKEQQSEILRELHSLTRDMIPANITLSVVANYVENITLHLDTKTTCIILSNFYPRNNLENLYLDGMWELDGAYYLNGYKTKNYIDFYPMQLRIAFPVHCVTELAANMLYTSDVLEDVLTDYRYTTKSESKVTKNLENTLQINSGMYYGIEPSIKVGCLSELKYNILLTSNYQFETEVEISVKYNKVVRICTSASVNIETDLNLATGKEVWYLDGSVLLDSSRLIPEKINNFDL